MNSPIRLRFQLTAASALVLAATGVIAEESGLYVPLAASQPALTTGLLKDASGAVQLGLDYAGDDSFHFGQYNGLNEEGAALIGNLQWQDFSSGDSYWQVSLSDMGLDTREGMATWGRPDRLKVSLGFDSQLQVRNDTGRTPFGGDTALTLPGDWVSGVNTSDWTALESSLHGFDREVERDKFFAELDARLSDSWKLDTRLSYEDKQGTGDVGGAIYPDLAAGDAVLLPQDIDYSTTEFDLGVNYTGRDVQLEGRLGYSDFDNKNDLLTWQNPYSSYGPDVGYPAGTGGLGLAPDSQQMNARLTGQYIFSPTARLQLDGSYAVTEQDQGFPDYTVNPNLEVSEPLPRSDFDGELVTTTFGARLLLRPLPKFNLEGFYRNRHREYDTPRDGYRYVRGDAADQPRPALTVYNTAHEFTAETMGLEGTYRLPLRSRLRLEYVFEMVERENAAVEETEEDRITVGYRIQPWSNFSANAELLYADRAADTYHWEQSYYALLDAELINATPDNQRYITHPDLSQYFLSNREQLEGKLDLNYLPAERWNLALNLLWHEDDYDKSELGLTEAQWQRLNFSATYLAGSGFSATAYAGYDRYESEQSSRAFRGGQDKNAFAIYSPLPQASDPLQNWDLDAEDSSFTLGANLSWQAAEDLSLELDYSYVDTTAEQDLTTYSSSVVASDLPDVDTTLHHLVVGSSWDIRDNISLRFDYQYYRFKSDDWSRQGVRPDTIGKVLTFGERNPNEQIHYVGASVIYRWQ